MTEVAALLQHEKFQSAPGSRVGTPAYLAPEVVLTTKGKTYDGKVNISCSLACCHTFDAENEVLRAQWEAHAKCTNQRCPLDTSHNSIGRMHTWLHTSIG